MLFQDKKKKKGKKKKEGRMSVTKTRKLRSQHQREAKGVSMLIVSSGPRPPSAGVVVCKGIAPIDLYV